MKSDFVELHQDGKSIFIKKNMIVAIYADKNFLDERLCDTIIECLDGYIYNVDENINEVIKCLE